MKKLADCCFYTGSGGKPSLPEQVEGLMKPLLKPLVKPLVKPLRFVNYITKPILHTKQICIYDDDAFSRPFIPHTKLNL